MIYGSAHVKGLYTVPGGSGTQFADGAAKIKALGLTCLKVYCTGTYLADYPLETAWSSVPTNLTQLAQTTEFTAQLNDPHWQTVIFTGFTFANGQTNWWRVEPSNARLNNEYNEIKNLAAHLLTTYNNSGKTFIIQQWEGDWAFLDSFDPATAVPRKYVDFYAAFLAVRQKAIEDARRETAHTNVKILHAIELNRVTDAKPGRRRILTDIAARLQPDLISYSAYDSTIVEQGSWGVNQAAWEAATRPVFDKALKRIKAAFPGVPVYIGEFGFPENEATNDHPLNDVRAMIRLVDEICKENGIFLLIYWQVFDNEPHGTYTYRGYWLTKPDNSTSLAGLEMQDLAT